MEQLGPVSGHPFRVCVAPGGLDMVWPQYLTAGAPRVRKGVWEMAAAVFVVERGHRGLLAPRRTGAPPWAIIARLLNYRDRDCVLRAACNSDKAVFENGNISIYPDYTNKVQKSRKGFLEVKAKLRAMNVRYMLVYSARFKVLSGGRSHLFEQPEEVWRWLEMWDKAAPGNLAGTGGVAHRVSRANGPDWRIRGGGLSKDTVAWELEEDPALRIEIQQDGTMAVLPVGSADGSGRVPEPELLLASAQV
ncbi:hypothetical protein NDU88_007547 [Pleurodeles waltl]|uniref:Uncharacterized protein n=1 Tax=Pleurodeles waltl TaxID=8319 RepID=A0AAV7VSM0_PLEWA|nr:hypothetical protein NDU88_007547 [Pleurodeles waltl]